MGITSYDRSLDLYRNFFFFWTSMKHLTHISEFDILSLPPYRLIHLAAVYQEGWGKCSMKFKSNLFGNINLKMALKIKKIF